jgi:hypothetical protein
MTKKSKTKNKSKKTTARKARNFEAHYLALILVAVLLLEGYFVTSTHRSDWQQGASVLDISHEVSETFTELGQVFQPIADAVDGVNEFYELSATAMMQVLDISEPTYELRIVTDGVYNFYQEASIQLSQLLDVTPTSSWPAHVAGVSYVAD